jgi:uncharacterized protein (UPF0332 family)
MAIWRRHAKASSSRYALVGNYAEEAGRTAYMAAFHAANALIITRTGKTPKTHSGPRSEFARVARREPRINREHVSLLGWSYELKNAADYQQGHRVSQAEARRAIDEAAQLIETIAAIINAVAGNGRS